MATSADPLRLLDDRGGTGCSALDLHDVDTSFQSPAGVDESMGGGTGTLDSFLLSRHAICLHSLQACEFNYPLNVRLHSDNGFEHAQKLSLQVESLLQKDAELSLYQIHVKPEYFNATIGDDGLHAANRDGTEDAVLTIKVKSATGIKSTQASLWSWIPVLEIQHNPGRTGDAATLGAFISQEVRNVFAEDRNSLSYLLHDAPFMTQRPTAELSREVRADLDARTTRAFKSASTYHLTFSLFTSSALPSAWEIETALKKTIHPLLDQLSAISQFTVDTQVQLYASFSPSMAGPQYDESSKQWKLEKSDLSGFINAAEWPLNPGIGSGPTINFVLFVPSKDQSPLVLAESGGRSWLIPQWGGVQILNPSGKQPETLTAKDLHPVMLTFADQLSSLVGLPKSPPSLALRISSLTRQRATSLVLSASSTLGALARLTLKLQSIAIPKSVASSVDATISHLNQACANMREGRYHAALVNARTAEEEAEQAFFEPSMVGQVYFPDEHKVAVYVPLLGPMAVPLVIALLNEMKKLLQEMRKSRKKAKHE